MANKTHSHIVRKVKLPVKNPKTTTLTLQNALKFIFRLLETKKRRKGNDFGFFLIYGRFLCRIIMAAPTRMIVTIMPAMPGRI